MKGARERLLAACPELTGALADVAKSIGSTTRLDPIVREIAILTVLRRSHSEVADRLHVARQAGISNEMVEAILDEDWTDPCFDSGQKAAFQFALQYDAGHTITDSVWETARQQFDEAALVELALACGHYGAIARFAVGFRLDQTANA
jgi:alkylhydroperoxidase family enzyme